MNKLHRLEDVLLFALVVTGPDYAVRWPAQAKSSLYQQVRRVGDSVQFDIYAAFCAPNLKTAPAFFARSV